MVVWNGRFWYEWAASSQLLIPHHICHLPPPTVKALFWKDIRLLWRSNYYCSRTAACIRLSGGFISGGNLHSSIYTDHWGAVFSFFFYPNSVRGWLKENVQTSCTNQSKECAPEGFLIGQNEKETSGVWNGVRMETCFCANQFPFKNPVNCIEPLPSYCHRSDKIYNTITRGLFPKLKKIPVKRMRFFKTAIIRIPPPYPLRLVWLPSSSDVLEYRVTEWSICTIVASALTWICFLSDLSFK